MTPSIDTALAALPTRADWAQGLADPCADLREHFRPHKRKPMSTRVSAGSRMQQWHVGRRPRVAP
jgi:hypothetical protein